MRQIDDEKIEKIYPGSLVKCQVNLVFGIDQDAKGPKSKVRDIRAFFIIFIQCQ